MKRPTKNRIIFDRILPWSHTFPWLKLLNITIPVAFFLLMFFFFPFRERFEFNPDEGIEAMKGLLLARGYPLYTEVWNEQPPIFTYMLATAIRAFGHDINALRTLVLLLSTLFLSSAFFFLRMTWGLWHALAGVLLLFLLPFYKTLSVSVMIGLPAIALAGLSLLALTFWHQRHANLWLVLSAAALSISILTKLFTGFLAPIFLVGILLDQKARLGETFTWSKLLKPAIIWGLVFAAITICLGLVLVGPSNIEQLLGTHLMARNAEIYTSIIRTHTINWHLRDSWPILLLALIGTYFILLQRNWLSLYLVAWVTIAYLLLSFQVPVWDHHQLLVTIPAAMLAGIAVGETVRLLPQFFHTRKLLNPHSLLIAGVVVSFVLTLITLAPQTYLDFTTPIKFLERQKLFLVRMTNHAPKTQWVVTDVPMYAFRIGRPIPPPLAVFSEKRLVTGNLTEEQVLDIINEYDPEQVMIGRFRFPILVASLSDDYRILYSRGRRALYLREDLKGN